MKTIKLTQGKEALVDDDDFEMLSQYKWRYHNAGYAATSTPRPNRKTLMMHRLVLGITDSSIRCDHKDEDRLNNQKSNLRASTAAQNGWNRGTPVNNTSGFKGVSFNSRHKGWVAQIVINRKHRYIGMFKTPDEAHEAYCAAASEFQGEFAPRSVKDMQMARGGK